jgi:hypothetical protein
VFFKSVIEIKSQQNSVFLDLIVYSSTPNENDKGNLLFFASQVELQKHFSLVILTLINWRLILQESKIKNHS